MAKSIIATGLACLDVMDVNASNPPKLSTGGFPNALIILKQKGWDSIPIVDLGQDRAGDYIIEEFLNWELDLRFTKRKADILTPIYILHHRNGGHFYGKECPHCHSPFPLYTTPISTQQADEIVHRLPDRVNAFYFDKVSPAALRLAQSCKDRSALVIFEPNRIEDEDLFRRSVAISDMVKYSRERRAGVQAITDPVPIPLEIETAGGEGLLYRTAVSFERSEWRFLPSIPATNFVDAAGSGDWLTASLINRFGDKNSFLPILRDRDPLEAAFIDGQKASAYNCQFAGARGALYANRPMLRGDDYCPFCNRKNEGKDR